MEEVAIQSIAAAFWSLLKFIGHLSTMNSSLFDSIFGIHQLWEEVFFSQIKIAQSRYGSHLTDGHLKCCLYLCIIVDPLSVSYCNLCSVIHQFRNRKVNENNF